MGFLKFLRGKLTALPEEIADGNIYITKGDKGIYADMGTERHRLNPPADWNETNKNYPGYIDNKPELGTVSSHDIAEELDQTQNIPTSKQVYNAIRDARAEFANSIKMESPYVAKGVTQMTDTSKVYVYTGTESGMNTGHWYWFDGTNWNDGGVYNSTAVDTDPTLLKGGTPADAAATGNFINELKGETDDLYSKVNVLTADMEELTSRADSFFDDLDVTSEGLVYGMQNGIRLNGPYGPFAGNGGGGGGGGGVSIDAVFTATNTTEWNATTISDGDSINFSFTWESIENDVPSGRGTVTITVNNVVKGNISVPQGENTINLKPYYSAGANKIRIRISDQYDQAKQWIVNLNVVKLTISSYFDTSFPFEDTITVPYTPVGNVSKTVYFVLDGEVAGTNVTSVSGKQLTYILPAQSHGSHTLDLYFTAEVNGQTVESNRLHYEFIAIRQGATKVIIVSPFTATNQRQYSSVVIPYTVYDPVNMEAKVQIYSGDTLLSTQTVNRSQQNFTYKANNVGSVEIRIVSGGTEKVIPLEVEESEINIQAETEGLELYLNSNGRNNNETAKDVWEYEDISAEMTNFGWKSLDGWINDSDGVTTLRTIGDARVYIPFKPFAKNFVDTGKTIEIEFATHNVINYNVPIITCMHDNVGFEITPQTVTFKSTQVELMTPFKDNEHIRVTIVVHSQNNNRLILFYVNGIMSSAVQYPADDSFSQGDGAVGISIGSNQCGVDIYNIRVYNQDFNREQVINNWIADTQLGDLLLDRYDRNNIFDNGVINPNTLPSNLPYWIINGTELPQYKGDKKTVTVSFTDPAQPAKSFTAEGVQINVQGTSSQAYYRKNYDLQFKKGFNLASGYSDNYTIIDAIPFNRFVLKADVASSESTNNTGLTMLYNDLCPYKVPEMIQNPKVRWGIEGRPCVVFWYNPDTGETEFLGKFNFNLPKRAPEPYGYSGNDESWEVERNNSANVQFQDTDFTTQVWDDDEKKYKPEWYDDWEARFPEDTWRDIGKLNEFVGWVKSTWTEEATNELLPSPITYNLDTLVTLSNYGDDTSYTVQEQTSGNSTTYSITFTKDTPAYRLTKFRAEAPQYMEIESATFYYLFTLFFLMIDSRAKNMFFGFHGSETTGLQYINRKAVFEPYDMDTAIGTNNSGVLKFGYYHLDTDTVSSIISGGDETDSGKEAPVFNAQGSVLWNNFREAFRAEYGAMYRELRTTSIFNYDYIENMYEQHQAMWPEALFNEDSYVKYLVPLVEDVTYDEDTEKYIKTDRYLTMLQGSKEQQRKWWLQNRFRYFDSMFTVGSADTSFIEMRLFNSGTLTVTPSQDLYVAVRFGRGSTTQRVRTTAGTPISFEYTIKEGMTVTEMESTIFSANLISDVGDLSVFYGNEFDFSKATRLRKLKLGDSSPTYNNANLNKLNVNNCYLLEEIDCRNCNSLTQPIALDGSPMLEKVYFDGTKITSISFVPGAPISILHLPSTITSLILVDHTNLTEFVCPSLENVTTLMLENIDKDIVDPVQVVKIIKNGARVNIRGFHLEITPQQENLVVEVPTYDEQGNVTGTEERTLTTDAEKAGYEIEQFLDSLDKMKGVQRERNSGTEEQAWVYHDTDKAIVSGTIHTNALTGAQIGSYKQRYEYLKIEADFVSSILYVKTWDGSQTVKTITCLNGIRQEAMPVSVARTSTAQYDYTFVGWSSEMDASENQMGIIDNVIADRTVYAAYQRKVRSYTVKWVYNSNIIKTETYEYGKTPSYKGTMPKDSYGYPGVWSPSVRQVTGDITYTVVFKPVYTATFVNDDNTQLYQKTFQQDITPTYSGSTPINSEQVEEGDFTHIGWTPALGPIKANTTYTAVYRDNRSLTVKYLAGALTSYETDSTITPRAYAFYYMDSLTRIRTMATTMYSSSCNSCRNLATIDLASTSEVTFSSVQFGSLNSLKTVIIRSKTKPTMGNALFQSTPIDGLRGAIFVDDNLILAYRGDTNWNKYVILPISEYTNDSTRLVELYDEQLSTIKDSWSDIIANNTDYSTKYNIGDTKIINGGMFGPILMELVAFDEDDKADGSGKARMTWIGKNMIDDYEMNTTDSTQRTGKYGSGGWAGSLMREHLIDEVLPQLDSEVSSHFVPVTKIQSVYVNNGLKVNGQTTVDSIWIPSHHEVGLGNTYESTGAIYSDKFTSNTERTRLFNGSDYWWLRSVYNNSEFCMVYPGGTSGSRTSHTYKLNVALGFCL